MMKKHSFKDYGLICSAILIYSISSLCSKLASRNPLFSWRFIFFYVMGLGVLLVYALIWQQVLKRFDLAVAYAAKPVTTLLSMMWGVLLFKEHISWNMAIGAVIIFTGVWIVVTDHEK